MLKNISKLELKINDKLYQLLCENDSPLNDVKEALFQYQKYVGQLEDNLKSSQEKEEKDKENKEEEIKPQ